MTSNPVTPVSTSAPAKSRPQITLEVLRKGSLSEHMVRIIAGGPGFASFVNNDFTDRYIKIAFPQRGIEYPLPLDLWQIREDFPREQWPFTRTYTIRWVDEAAQELAIDFVVHGDEGLAGPWARDAQPGDALVFTGPGGAYSPAVDTEWHLFAGDDAAVPAISAALEYLPRDAKGAAVLEVNSQADVQAIDAPEGVQVQWLFREGIPAGASDMLINAVSGIQLPEARVYAFVHGERGYMKSLRAVLFTQFGLERSQVSLSGYWAMGRVEDEFQAEKKTPVGKI
ncbi:siderophore-interacting protein [Pseudarthrobacter sp. J1738]|uniref:siderophore-interacting protein n=1 Tax=Pseudarthrobacter sp. J1738 TaxID=3420446 RepID=UPI003D28F8CE